MSRLGEDGVADGVAPSRLASALKSLVGELELAVLPLAWYAGEHPARRKNTPNTYAAATAILTPPTLTLDLDIEHTSLAGPAGRPDRGMATVYVKS